MGNRLDNLKIEDLKTYVHELEEQLKTSKKYGLIWDKDDTLESNPNRCLTEIPVLSIQKDLGILNKINHSNKTNILIEGDNYFALSSLKMINYRSVDLIYIDPPYNTGNKDFTYNDRFVDAEDGYRHSKWLSFMSKRLKLARELLSDDGVIFISIDDNEQANLKLLCDSIFGENNFITQFIWEKTQHFGRQKSIFILIANMYFAMLKNYLVQKLVN